MLMDTSDNNTKFIKRYIAVGQLQRGWRNMQSS